MIEDPNGAETFMSVLVARARQRLRRVRWMAIALYVFLLTVIAITLLWPMARGADVGSFVNRWAPIEKPQTVPELVTPPAEPPLVPHTTPHHVPHRDVCARTGGHREDYTRNGWRAWRCVYRRG